MPEIIFKTVGNDPLLGKFETPVRAVITEENDRWLKEKSHIDLLFNRESSSRAFESIYSETGFGLYNIKAEGEDAETDTFKHGMPSVIVPISFGKSFIISYEMAQDAVMGKAVSLSRQDTRNARSLVSAYHRTIQNLTAKALGNGHLESLAHGDKNISLKVGDNLPLFSGVHKLIDSSAATQSNFYHNNEWNGSVSAVDDALLQLSHNLRNLKDENKEALGYVADTIVIPGNRPQLGKFLRIVLGSYKAPGTANNDINIAYSNYDLVILPQWESDKDEMIVMSRVANEELLGNMLYDRAPLTITSDYKSRSGNLEWTALARAGIGFHNYKHAIKLVASADTVGTSVAL